MFKRQLKLKKELLELRNNPPENVRVGQDWTFFITGPADSPYSGTEFKLHVHLANYPLLPPKITMATKPAGLVFDEKDFEKFMRRKWRPCYSVVSRIQEFANFIFYPGRLDDSVVNFIVTENRVERKKKSKKFAKFPKYQNSTSNFCVTPFVWPSIARSFVKFILLIYLYYFAF